MNKKNWETPRLICLCRSKPEEAVLGACKTIDTDVGPTGGFDKCCTTGGPTCDCCESIWSS